MKIKAEILVSLIVLVAIGFVIGIFLSVYSPSTSSHPAEESSSTGNDVQAVAAQTPNFTITITSGQNICEGCHLSGKKFIPQAYSVKQHVEGGAYCLECHKIDHNVHPINNNVTCERCHGAKSPQMPVFRNGTIACAECHDYPDPMKPSNGNLIVIHRPRGVDCTKCHTDSCLKCHSEIKSNAKWEKRLGHFKALLGTVQ